MASALRDEGFVDAARIMERIASGEIGGRGPVLTAYYRGVPRRTARSIASLRDLWGDLAPSPRRGNSNMRPDDGPVKEQRDAKPSIADVIASAKGTGHAPGKAEIGVAAEWVVAAAQGVGIDIADYRHIIDGFAVRHILKQHGNEGAEARRGQMAVTEADILSIQKVISEPDAVAFGHKTRLGRDAVIYAKVMPDNTAVMVEELRTKRGEAAVNTMWKKASAAKDANALKRILLSNVRNDSGTSVKIFTRDEAVKEQRDMGAIREALTAKARKAGVPFGFKGWRKGSAFWSDLLTDTMSRSTGATPEVMDAIWQRWLETLPDQSIRTSKIHRKGRQGYSKDAVAPLGRRFGVPARRPFCLAPLAPPARGGKSSADEPVSNTLLLLAAEQNAIGGVEGSSGPTDLLVIGNDRARHLIVDHERQIRLVITHAQSGCGDKRLDLIIQQSLFQFFAALARFPGIGCHVEPLGHQPVGKQIGVANGQGVDDSMALQPGQLPRDPGQALGLAGQADRLQGQRGPVEIAFHDMSPGPRTVPRSSITRLLAVAVVASNRRLGGRDFTIRSNSR